MHDLPIPPVPPDCDLQDFAYMPLDVRRLRDSDLASLESSDACWSAVLLWCASWHQVPAASLPDDDRVLSNLAGFGKVVKEWLRVKDGAMRGWVKCSDGRLYHPVVAEKAAEAWHAKLERVHGKFGERVRKLNKEREAAGLYRVAVPSFDHWNSTGRITNIQWYVDQIPSAPNEFSGGNSEFSGGNIDPIPGNPTENSLKGREGKGEGIEGKGEGIVNPCCGDAGLRVPSAVAAEPTEPATTSASNASPSATPKPRASATGTRLPDGWALPKAWGEWALSERNDLTADDIRREAACFSDYWHSKAGADARKVDWEATWRNWVRRSAASGRGGGKQAALESRNAAVVAGWKPPELREVA